MEAQSYAPPATDAMKVLIADDHGIVRSGLRMLLERQMDIEVVGEASDGAEAHSNEEIASIRHLSEKTVENRRSNAMGKLGMRDRVELVRYAIRKGLIEP